MKTEALDLSSLASLLTSPAASTGAPDPADEPEHPLARELRAVIANRDTRSVGDLARVVDEILREMTMLKAEAGPLDADKAA